MPESYLIIDDGGFVALNAAPSRGNPRDWMAWHFTHQSNIPGILADEALLPSLAAKPVTNVGQLSIKHDRERRPVDPGDGYPASVVSDHVPLYFAAKSPMLFKVCCGHPDYRGGSEPLVFLGFRVGDIVESGCTWCASNANAAASWAQYSRDVDQLGTFVDFDLLTAKLWGHTPDDAGRPARRAAELLVRDRLPIALVRLVVTKTQRVADEMTHAFDTVALAPKVLVRPSMYYKG